jgi:hypothetical protein
MKAVTRALPRCNSKLQQRFILRMEDVTSEHNMIVITGIDIFGDYWRSFDGALFPMAIHRQHTCIMQQRVQEG